MEHVKDSKGLNEQKRRGQNINAGWRYHSFSLVAVYLIAIVIANWLVSRYGPSVSVWTAFGFIGLNLTTRDHLHDAWRGPRLKRNMVALIAAGSLLSIPFNAGRIAAASFGAFVLSETLDAIVYHRLGGWPRWTRINGSNVASAALDSVAFPALAFGFPLLYSVMLGQFAAKVGGGFLWSLVIAAVQQEARRWARSEGE